MDIDTNNHNGISTMTPGDSSEHEDDTTPNEHIPLDMDMPDHPGHSPTPEVQSTTHHRPTIASLCNPSNEDIYVRPHRADTLFDKTLEPVQIPSRIRGCSSESLYIYMCVKPLNNYLLSAEIDIFLNQLTESTIDHAIACFNDALLSREVLPRHFDTRNAHITCNRIMRMTQKTTTARALIYKIPDFWSNLNGLLQSSNLNAIEASITRVFCMQGARHFHNWLLYVVPAAVDRKSRTTWIDQLAQDVVYAIEQGQAVTFRSINYLPRLDIPREYTVQATAFRYDQRDVVISNMSSILRQWLYFPTDDSSLVQLSLIDIVLSKSPASVLFLEAIWEMYKTPFSTVFNLRWQSRSKKKINDSLTAFQKQFDAHPFATPGSMAYCKLEYLGHLIQRWFKNDDLTTNPVDVVSCLTFFKFPLAFMI